MKPSTPTPEHHQPEIELPEPVHTSVPPDAGPDDPRLDFTQPVLPAYIMLDIITSIDNSGWPLTPDRFHDLARTKHWIIDPDYPSLTYLPYENLTWVHLGFAPNATSIDTLSIDVALWLDDAPNPNTYQDLLTDTYATYAHTLNQAYGEPIRIRNTPKETSLTYQTPTGASYQIKKLEQRLISEMNSPKRTANLTDPGNLLAP